MPVTERVQPSFFFYSRSSTYIFWQREFNLLFKKSKLVSCVHYQPPHSKHLYLLPAIRKKAMQFSKTVNPFPQLISILYSLGFCLQLKWFLHQFFEHSLLSSSLSIFLRSLCALWMGSDTWCCAISIRPPPPPSYALQYKHWATFQYNELHFKELDNSASYWYWSYQYQPTSTPITIICSPIRWATSQNIELHFNT